MAHAGPARLASLDLGTNTFLLLIAEVAAGTITPILDRETIVRLGKGVEAAGNLNAAAMQRGYACLQEYVALARQYQAEKIFAVGTSALRDAANRAEFIDAALAQTGVRVEVISGEKEARLIFAGTVSNKTALPAPLAVLDIGGGSTEVVMGEAVSSPASKNSLQARSADIGSVRLTERFIQNDPVQPEEMMRLRRQTETVLRATWPAASLAPVKTLIGTAGTITTLAAMAQAMREYDAARIDGYLLTRQKLGELIMALRQRTVAQRCELPGLAPARADVILAGAIILETFLDLYKFPELLVSDRGLRYGVLAEAAAGLLRG